MREVIKTGRTVEDATELALAELGVSAEEAGIEVLELPQRRLFKSIPAKVRAYVEDEGYLLHYVPAEGEAGVCPVHGAGGEYVPEEPGVDDPGAEEPIDIVP